MHMHMFMCAHVHVCCAVLTLRSSLAGLLLAAEAETLLTTYYLLLTTYYLLLTTYYLLLAGLLLAAEAETSRGARERAGVISSFALMVGLSVGSASGLLISKTVAAPT